MDIKYIAFASLSALALTSCSSDSYTELERTKDAFLKQLGGDISQLQWWRTAVTLNVKVKTEAPTKLWLMSGKDKGTLYDYKELSAAGSVQMVAPQGQGNTLYLVSVCDHQKDITPITLTGKMVEGVNLIITLPPTQDRNEVFVPQPASNQAKMQALSKETTDKVGVATLLKGSSIKGNAFQNEFSKNQVSEALYILGNAYKEFISAKSLGANCDYELKSNGEFNITWFAGNSQSSESHILGYYYHTPGTYKDIQYVDLSETDIYDYIDNMPKVQYKVNEQAAQQYGVKADHWYDANFDMGDTFDDPHPNLSARRNDDAYNSIAVYNRYGNNISAIRGISFTVKVPKGKYVGFYHRIEGVSQPEQYDRFVKMDIKPYTSRDKFKAMNFSCEAMNMNMKGSYRSCVFKTPNAIWLGMENDYTGGDLDCNDVMFEVSADLEIYNPTIVEPDLKPFGEYDDLMPWTIAYEDVARQADFDFNDAVIRLLPNPEKEKCCVKVMAAGSPAKMYLHYDGPDGDINLGEIHELLGGSAGTTINTTNSIAETAAAQVTCVTWPKDYCMKEDAHRFYIEVQRGTCKDCSDVITLPEEPGQMPEAILIAGEWKWPMEGIHINTVYPSFSNWCKDVTNQNYWDWYAQPLNGKVVEVQ